MPSYLRRAVDDELDLLLPEVRAVAVDGPKGVGKTETCARRADQAFALDDPEHRRLLAADPGRLRRVVGLALVDEWQRVPEVWDVVRRAVDDRDSAARFLLTGSASPAADVPLHSGAGRIVRLRMRPMSLPERAVHPTSVSLAELCSGGRAPVEGECALTLDDYVDQIVGSGLPGLRGASARVVRAQLDSYVDRIVDHDFAELGHQVRRPATLRRWLRAYAAATATSTSYNKVLDAATAGESDKPAKTTTIAYRDVLERLWLLDPIPGWTPGGGHLGRLQQSPKHHLADPALAARLLGAGADSLLRPGRSGPADGALLGQLFESLTALTVQASAQVAEGRVHHLRTGDGRHEVDFVVERPDGRVLAVEAKLSATVDDGDVRHLAWMRERLGPDLVDAVVVTTGRYAYRRPDGVAVVPLGLLGV